MWWNNLPKIESENKMEDEQKDKTEDGIFLKFICSCGNEVPITYDDYNSCINSEIETNDSYYHHYDASYYQYQILDMYGGNIWEFLYKKGIQKISGCKPLYYCPECIKQYNDLVSRHEKQLNEDKQAFCKRFK